MGSERNMKFLMWILNIFRRHYKDAIRYNRGGVANRIIVMIVLSVLVVGSLALEYYCLSLIKENIAYGFLIAILAIILLLATIELCLVYCFFGFSFAATGSLESILMKNQKKRNQQPSYYQESTKRPPKLLDVLVGFFGVALAIGTVIGAFLVFTAVME